MTRPLIIIGLDVGEKRIGVAKGDSSVRLSFPLKTIDVDGNEIDEISQLIKLESADVLVVGYPRNQSGEATKQTQFVEEFVKRLPSQNVKIVFQDESLTSVIAEQRLKAHKKPYQKSDIDAMAASIILQDYIEFNYAG
jgi:putative Holliday junction resolvase